jgi:hypothetical protein
MADRGSVGADPRAMSQIATENGAPNGAPIRGQKPSQRVTTHRKVLPGPEVTKRQAQSGIPAFGGRKKWWTGGELNSRHRDFQSRALACHPGRPAWSTDGSQYLVWWRVSCSAPVAPGLRAMPNCAAICTVPPSKYRILRTRPSNS